MTDATPPTWLRPLVNILAALGVLALPVGALGVWLHWPNFAASWLLAGFGCFLLCMTWSAYFASQLYGRFVSGAPLFGNAFIALALLLGPKPILAPLAFALDPLLWAHGWREWRARESY